MAEELDQQELRSFVRAWTRSLIEKDIETLEALRDDGYLLRGPGDRELTREGEIRAVGSPGVRLDLLEARNVRVQNRGDEGRITAEFLIQGDWDGQPIDTLHRVAIAVRRSGGRWRASHFQIEEAITGRTARPEPPFGPTPRWRRLVPGSVRRWLKARLKPLSPVALSFQDLAYQPHEPGSDYVVPPRGPVDDGPDLVLPIPPRELWLGYNYPVHGKQHVDAMLEIVAASGVSFEPGDRILDLGCGAGRMIRHLQPLAATCEIWGADISATHILWCKRNLSPPFHFVTTTKVPHLPFEDRSFRLIYCGSLFTHIDDLADAWLLELRRILAPGGRVYVTIHDNRTIELFQDSHHAGAAIVKQIKSSRTYQDAKACFGMFTIGRDNESMVFYDRAYFSEMASHAFDIVSVTPEAYFYQTAFLLTRKGD